MKRFAYLTALVVSLVLAAGANAAIGSTRPDDRPTHGQGAIVLEQRNDAVRPDDRAIHGQGAVQIEQVTPAGHVPLIAPSGSEAVRVDRFDWLDAGIGAAAALGLGLIVAGSALALRRAHAPAYS
jgi:hypothetical protein